MEKYTVESPEFNNSIDICETTDTNHADNINAGPKQIFENTICNKEKIDELNQSIEELENRSISDTEGINGLRLYNEKLQRYDSASKKWVDITGSGGTHVGNSPPSDTKLLWIDTGNGGISKYYNGTAWVPTKAVWG